MDSAPKDGTVIEVRFAEVSPNRMFWCEDRWLPINYFHDLTPQAWRPIPAPKKVVRK